MYYDEEFFKELIGIFRLESSEHLTSIKKGLPVLLDTSDSNDWSMTIEEVFRAAHSLKGAARTVGLVDIESISLKLEKAFSFLKNNKHSITEELESKLNMIVDELDILINTINDKGKLEGETIKLSRDMDNIEQILRQMC